MAETWLDEHVGPEVEIRPEFEQTLERVLSAAWREPELTTVEPAAHRPKPGRWRVGVWMAGAAAVIAGLIVVVASRPSDPTRPVDTVAPTTAVPTPTTTSAGSSTTTDPATSTTTSTASHVELVVPLVGGDELQPVSIATVPTGSGPGQLAVQNGEFVTPLAVFPDSIVVLEDVPFSGFTGRALRFDRRGQWDRDLRIDGIAGTTPLWVGGAPDGILFVAAIDDQAPAGPSIRVTAHRLDGDTYSVIDEASLPDLSATDFRITIDGLMLGSDPIFTVVTGAPERIPTADRVKAYESFVRVGVNQWEPSYRRWLVDVEIDPDAPPQQISTRAGTHGDGVWYAGSSSDDPTVDDPFLVLLGDAGPSWYRLGPWSLAASDDEQLVLTRVTTDGLVIAVVGEFPPPPPDLGDDLLAEWPDPPASGPTLAEVPLLLPAAPIPAGATRTEYGDQPVVPADYGQYWVDPANDALLWIETGILQGPASDGEPVTVAPWDRAFLPRMSPGFAQVVLVDPAGMVTIWSHGLDRGQLLDIAASLRVRSDGLPGWDVGALPAGLRPVHEAWGLGYGFRTVHWTDAELVIAGGSPATVITPWEEGAQLGLDEVGGAMALTFDNGDWAAVTWSPEPDMVVVYAAFGTLDEVLTTARSIGAVDAATWEAASTDVTEQADDCASLFFC